VIDQHTETITSLQYETLPDALEVFEHGSGASAKVGNIEEYI